MRKTLVAVVALASVVTAKGSSAQDPDPFARDASASAGPALDSVRIGFQVGPEWRGFALGAAGLDAFVDFALAGYPTSAAGDWGMSAHTYAATVFSPRFGSVATDLVGGGLDIATYFRGGRSTFGIAADGYWVNLEQGDDASLEVGVELTGVEFNWGLEEVYPTISLGVYRDFGFFDGWRGQADANLGFGVQNVAFWVFNDVSAWAEGSVWWSEYDAVPAARDDWGGRYGLGVALDQGLLSLNIRLGNMHPLDAPSRIYGEAALRIWPDGRDL